MYVLKHTYTKTIYPSIYVHMTIHIHRQIHNYTHMRSVRGFVGFGFRTVVIDT